MHLLLISRRSQVHAEQLDSTVTPDDSRLFDGSILGFYHVKQVFVAVSWTSSKTMPRIRTNERTSVTVSLRVVSTCWPWPSCCPTRIAAVLRVTWWLGNTETARTRPAFVQCLRGVKLGMFDACCMFKRQEVKKAQEGMTILDWEHLREPISVSNSYLIYLQQQLLHLPGWV